MMKFAILTTILTATAGAAVAQGATKEDLKGVEIEPALATDVAARVAELRSYGDRFETVARLIELRAEQPEWSWNTCERVGEQVVASLPES